MSIATDEPAAVEEAGPSFTYQPWRVKEIRRLYVNLPDGTKVGYLDLSTLEQVPDAPETEALLRAALAGLSGTPAAVPPTQREPLDRVPAMPWEDLAENRPGQRIEHLEDPSYRAGVAGEQRTAGILAGLERRGYRVLHALPLSPRKDLDHLLIGSGGIFAVNTKATTYEVALRSGEAYSDGYRQNWVESIGRDAGVVAEILSRAARMHLECEPLLSVWSTVGVLAAGPVMWAGECLQDAVLSRPALFPESWVDVIYNAARRSDAWALPAGGRH
jgi:hypothetical protein